MSNKKYEIRICLACDEGVINEVVLCEEGYPPFEGAHKFMHLFETSFVKRELDAYEKQGNEKARIS